MKIEEKAPKRAAIYLRVSSVEQLKGQGLTFQREYCLNRIEEEGWMLQETYSDEGLSGRRNVEKREAFIQMLNDGLAGEFDVLVIYDNLRFGRNDNVDIPALLRLTDEGVRIVS